MKDTNATVRRQTDDFITLPDLWHICVAHWSWFILSLIVFVGIASLYLYMTPDRYTREAAVLVKQDSQGKNAGKSISAGDFNDIGLVQQSTNVNNVLRQFSSLDVLTEVAHRVMHPKTDNEAMRMAESIKQNLNVDLDNDKSTIVNIKYTDPSPAMAERVLKEIVEVYNEKWLADKNQMAANTSSFISDRLALLERDLGSVDDSISRYKTRNKITDLEHVSDIYLQQQSQSDAEILQLTSQRSMASYILDILKNKSARHQLLPTNSGINNQVAESQIAQYNSLLLQLKSNLVGTSSQNPLIIKQEEELDDIRKNILSTIESYIKTLGIQLQALEGYNGEANSKISSNPTQAKHLVSVEREQKVKESLYLYLLQKKEENEISMTYSAFNTQIIDMPHGSDLPTSPNKRMVIFAAVVLALICPAVVLFVKESTDTTVRDRSDIEHKTNLPLVGDIPYCNTADNHSKGFLLRHRSRVAKKLIVEQGEQDIVNEAFRLIRTNIEFMTPHRGENNVYITTSVYAGTGKTFVSTNLAVALSLTGKWVLFIDGDLRHASASRIFNAPGKGLADYLAEQEPDIETLLHHSDIHPTLDILPVGTIPPNPTELLSGERLSRLFDEVRHRYDYIIIDCPPMDTLADTGLIERYADRTLFIVRAGQFERKRLDDIEADAANGKYKHMSIILNATKGGRYGYHYGYRYGYRYGYNKK